MRKTDLSPERRALLVPVASHPGAYALVPPLTPRVDRLTGLQGLHGEVSRAHTALANLQTLAHGLPNPDLVTRTADRREAVRSSQIEGTNSGIDELLTYEATGSDEGLPPDVRVTLNYVTALEYGLQRVRERGVAAFTNDLVKELHARLMSGGDNSWAPGEYRDKQNWIGSLKIDQARFVPPPAGNVPDCMDDVISMLRYAPAEEDQIEMPIVVRMAVVHAQFETIHPFFDGNGRVGRIILPLMLAAEGYPPVYLSGYLKDNQREYYDTLAGVQLKGKWAEWIRFFAIGVDTAVQESIGTALGLGAILRKWQDIVGGLGLRRQSVLHKFPELMLGTPVLTAHKAKNALGISFPSASAALAMLEEKGVLFQREKHRRYRTFYAREVIELLNRPAGTAGSGMKE
ncbi:Fic family protein [Geobacter sp. AOG2]|uniref:Fic family protein n=1 Tax=Geobacter sp. AOG2 TaxID=1566347 RepID=UPI001CC7979C|nr:Fic/DOC family N-terminal domain-containing protein [Geobacter sp. AOG2]GFE62616.1 cell division protein Fic [Geobacter sp. AOG2]